MRESPSAAAILSAFLAVLFATLMRPVPGLAAELVMFEAPGCGWCVRWWREVGAVYPKTGEARLAPLRPINGRSLPGGEATLAAPVVYTPTFVLLEGGREVGRITGYAGEAFFWEHLAIILARLPPPAAAAGH